MQLQNQKELIPCRLFILVKLNMNTNFKLIVRGYVDKANTCSELRKYRISETNVWQWKKDKGQLLGINSTTTDLKWATMKRKLTLSLSATPWRCMGKWR